ncbi:MAG: ACT domain-containing protein [Oscillospiraceae bacterium]|nr:ACT domain-containing protein [Oscillospiraceae bacterium]
MSNNVMKISSRENVTLVTFENAPHNAAFLEEIFGEIADNGINIDMISQTAPTGNCVTLSFTIDESDMVGILRLANKLGENHLSLQHRVSGGNAKISLYSEDMPGQIGVAARVFSALAGIDVEIVIITTSEVDVSVLVGSCDLPAAFAALSSEFGL